METSSSPAVAAPAPPAAGRAAASRGEAPPGAAALHVAIRTEALDAAAVEARVAVEGAGGVCVFRGRIRPQEQGRRIAAMTYEHYAGMAEREMARVAAAAAARWPLLAVAVEHRVGEIAAGEDAVVVAVGAGHREEAFAACRWVIDEVKRSVPIWKGSEAGPGVPDAAALLAARVPAAPGGGRGEA